MDSQTPILEGGDAGSHRHEVQASIRRVFGVDSCLIPNGIPVASYQPSEAARREWREREQFQPGDVIFVCVARFEPVKNHDP